MKQSLTHANHFAMLLMALAMSLEASTFADARDGKIYKTVKIGSQTWMAENLNHKIGNSACYGNDEANCKKHGRLYDFNTAMKACPSGWHLPSQEEWSNLMVAAGGKKEIVNDEGGPYYHYYGADKKLKSKIGWSDFNGNICNGADEFGFSATPGGIRGSDGEFSNIGISGEWWSSTNTEDEWSGTYYVQSMGSCNFASGECRDMANWYSIRCVQGVGGTASKAATPAADTDYSPALQTHYSKGTLGESGKTRPIEMFFQKVSKNGGSYSISGKSKTKAAEDAFSGTLSISSQTAGGSCNSGETELKGSYDLNEKESKTSGHFVGTFIACEKSGKLSKANFKGNWVKHANGNKTPCEFGI